MTNKDKSFLYKVNGEEGDYRNGKIKAIAFYYGKKNQHRIIAEECNELAKEALKGIRNNFSNKSELTEEIADVLIMINQVIELNEIDRFEIYNIMDNKLERQIERIKEEIGAKNEAERKS